MPIGHRVLVTTQIKVSPGRFPDCGTSRKRTRASPSLRSTWAAAMVSGLGLESSAYSLNSLESRASMASSAASSEAKLLRAISAAGASPRPTAARRCLSSACAARNEVLALTYELSKRACALGRAGRHL